MLHEDDYSKKYEDFNPNSSESYIMFNTVQKVFQAQSENLAAKIQTQFRERVNRYDRDVKQAGFWVLYNTKMPSVLVETGFITSPVEEKYLTSKEGQDYLAASIYRACRDYLNEIDNRSGIATKKNQDSIQVTDTISDTHPQNDNIFFMVQVASSVSKIDLKPDNFKGLKDVREMAFTGRYKYTSGSFTDFPDAVKYRNSIDSLYPDAFVIAVKDNKILSLPQALEQKRKQKDN